MFSIKQVANINGICSGNPLCFYISPFPEGYTVAWSVDPRNPADPIPNIEEVPETATAKITFPIGVDPKAYSINAKLTEA
jgi:hypothetical protein